MSESINIDTNIDIISKDNLLEEARLSMNRSRIQLLRRIHAELESQPTMETAYEYDPTNAMSFSGEFEAICV